MSQAAVRGDGEAGWAAPADREGALAWNPPASDGAVTRWDSGVMTVSGAANATIFLVLLVVASAAVTWVLIPESVTGEIVFPTGWVIGGALVALVASIVAIFKPRLSKVLGPVYALAQGVAVGAISRAYDQAYDGIVLQAVGATLAVFLVMLGLYRSRVIRVTDRTRRIVFGMMMGLMGFYLVSFIFAMFGARPSFISDASPLGIAFSLFVAGLAAFNLALDFDMIEKAAAAKMPSYMEWYCALGVTVTLVWLYLELLRLLAKLREN